MKERGERARGSKKGMVESGEAEGWAREMKWEDYGKAELEGGGDKG